jgi:hypothetical protein
MFGSDEWKDSMGDLVVVGEDERDWSCLEVVILLNANGIWIIGDFMPLSSGSLPFLSVGKR